VCCRRCVRHPPFATASATLPSPVNFKFLKHIKAWILPLDSSVDNHFCTIDNSISLCTPSLSTIQQTQWQIHNGGYTAADTQRQIHSGRYTAVPNQDTQWRIHSRSLGDLPDIVTSPPCSTFRILGAAKPPPMLVCIYRADSS